MKILKYYPIVIGCVFIVLLPFVMSYQGSLYIYLTIANLSGLLVSIVTIKNKRSRMIGFIGLEVILFGLLILLPLMFMILKVEGL